MGSVNGDPTSMTSESTVSQLAVAIFTDGNIPQPPFCIDRRISGVSWGLGYPAVT